MINMKYIKLTPEELKMCHEFSARSAHTQQDKEFGQDDTKPRTPQEIARDNLIGKIAEVAFSKMMKENYGIDVALDFNCYPRGKWDNQDAEINGWRIDVKGTRQGGSWMLIEWNKLNFRQKDNNLSHLYAMFTVGWNHTNDSPTGYVSYEGSAFLTQLTDSCPITVVLRRGTKLPATRKEIYLQADNYGILFKDLNKNLNHLVSDIKRTPPLSSMTDDYKNPYNGKTTLEIIRESK